MLPLLLIAYFPALLIATYVVPLQGGPYGVSIQDYLLTDDNLPDPFLNISYRRIPISVIAPSGSSSRCKPIIQPYMPDATAKFWETEFASDYFLPFNNTLTQTQVITCKPSQSNQSSPVVLFAAGAGISRYFYNILGSAITAQTGYTVITFDVPGQTEFVAFPDGTTEGEAPQTDETTFTNTIAINNVVENAVVILDAIFAKSSRSESNITSTPSLPRSLRRTKHAAMIGHSQGGAAALSALLNDARLSSGANLDGGLNSTLDDYNAHGPSSNTTTTKPFAIIEHQGFNQSSVYSWAPIWADVLRGSKWQFQLNDSQHTSFGDFPYLVDLYGIRQKPNISQALVDLVVGPVPGSIVFEILKEVLGAFLDYGFKTRPAKFVDDIATQFEPWGFETVNQTVVDSHQYQR